VKARKKKLTLLVDAGVLEGMRRAVGEGWAPSQSALVQEAVTEYLVAKEREALQKAYGDAASDPGFLADVEAVRRDFRFADADPDLDVPS
jgi:hypothetical protein